jgi:hypothetical protein
VPDFSALSTCALINHTAIWCISAYRSPENGLSIHSSADSVRGRHVVRFHVEPPAGGSAERPELDHVHADILVVENHDHVLPVHRH